MKLAICWSVGVLLLGACSPRVPPNQPQRSAQQQRDTIVVSADTGFALIAQQTVCDHPMLAEALRNPQLSDLAAYDLMHHALTNALLERGLAYQSKASESCDYWLAFAIPSSQQLSDLQLMSLFGVSPGLADDGNQDFQRATLYLSLYQPGSGRPSWQLSMQAFAAVEIDQQGRRKLKLKPEGVDYVINRIFAHLKVDVIRP
ncbi:hypothetical protein [Agarivorans sp. QJM3NY_33]|uniref:hypothetical protein n=1 Tax=Agarivorans sp. QJM3NY_33 TaxID=3421432 RepID=UPI003D7D2921